MMVMMLTSRLLMLTTVMVMTARDLIQIRRL